MDLSESGSGGADSSAGAAYTDSALVGAAPSDDAHQQYSASALSGLMMRGSGADTSHRGGPSSAELSGALGSLLRRQSPQSMEDALSGGVSRFSSMFRDLKSDDGARQITALTELSEYLSFSSEEALISFPMETFVPVLIGLLEDQSDGDELAAQAMILSCRCLFNVVDILPPTTRIITAAGGLPVLCANLLNVAYIDVAELAVAIIERISEDQPLQVLKSGGLQAITMFLDFFQIAVQRQAMSAAALMLQPVPPQDVFDQHVKSVLPTLTQLLQHSDPQVLQSVCECWRRLLDNTIAIHAQPRTSPGLGAASSSSPLGQMVAKGKWRGSPGERGRKEPSREEAIESSAAAAAAKCAVGPAAPAAPPRQAVSAVLEEIVPSGVVSHLLVLLANGVASPSPHSSVVMNEVLYILSVLTNYSDTFTKEVFSQDICGILRQMVLAMDLLHGGQSSSQANFVCFQRVLSTVASILPAVRLVDATCECEEGRVALLQEEPAYLDQLGEAFLPVLVEAYEASTDPSLQSLCVTLLLALFLACRERTDMISRCLDPTRVACLMVKLLMPGTSKSVMLACLLIVYELLARHPQPYALLFVRHGVVRAIHQLVTRHEEPRRRPRPALGSAAAASAASAASAAAAPRARSKAQLVDEAAHRVLSSYFASFSLTGESEILKSLSRIAEQLRSSPTAVIAAHREALEKLHELLLAPEGVTAFEFTCSGAVGALCAFLHPATQEDAGAVGSCAAALGDVYGDRLRLFLECIGRTSDGVFPRLVRLCVAAAQRVERFPLSLFPTHSSLGAALPPHLRPQGPPQASAGAKNTTNLGVLGGDNPLGFTARRSQDAGGTSAGSSSLAVLRLLAKPIRVRMASHCASSAGVFSGLPTFRQLMMPFGGKAASPRFFEAKAGSPALSSGAPGAAVTAAAALHKAIGLPPSAFASAAVHSEPPTPAASPASPAARLRNFLASKVSRKRSVGSAAASPAASGPAPAVKRASGVAGLLGRAGADAAEALRSARAAEDSSWAGSWGDDDDSAAASGSFARGSAERDDGGSSRAAERAREQRELSDMVEAVLLVEPLATISALEEYIWEKHGQRFMQELPIQSPSSTDTSVAAAAAAATPASARINPFARGSSDGSVVVPSEAPRPRLSSKQAQPKAAHPQWLPASALSPRPSHRDGEDPLSPTTPLAIVDPGTPSQEEQARLASASGPQLDSDGPPSDGEIVVGSVGTRSRGGAPRPQVERKRVNIYHNGQRLTSKTSVVQALVASLSRAPPRGKSRDEDSIHAHSRTDRFIVMTEEEESNSEGEDAEGTSSQQVSSRHFCGTIWGRVHGMTYEIVDEPASPKGASQRQPAGLGAGPTEEGVTMVSCAVVATDFDCLVQRHARITASITGLQCQLKSAGANPVASSTVAAVLASSAAAAEDDGVLAELTPRSGGETAAGGDASAKEGAADEESFYSLLQLISAFDGICDFIRADQEFPGLASGIPSDDDFHCSSLANKLLRQLSDPLAICTGSIPLWCKRLPGSCRFLLPHSARRVLHHSCGLGLSRALHHVQQRALAQHATGADAQRRLEGEVAVASIPRQKVRISRQRLLENAIKVMNNYGGGSTILEVEYVGEVGTGSGPTLEFYAQVAEILRFSEPPMFRTGTPLGFLFPMPMTPLVTGSERAASQQQVIDRFRLLGQVVAKSILDNRLVDLQLHPLFWRSVLNQCDFSRRSLREVDPELYNSTASLTDMEDEALAGLCIDFTLPGHPDIELKPDGARIMLSRANFDEYVAAVAEATLVTGVAQQVAAFRTAFSELLPLETCRIWSERELASIIIGSSVRDNAAWTLEHLGAHIKAQHGYHAESRCFRDLINSMAEFTTEDRRKFLTFVTGAPTLPIGGFGGLKPPLTVVKKEAPPAPLTTDQFMPSVMTCANYLKLPEYSSSEILRQKLSMAMSEGQSAFLLS